VAVWGGEDGPVDYGYEEGVGCYCGVEEGVEGLEGAGEAVESVFVVVSF